MKILIAILLLIAFCFCACSGSQNIDPDVMPTKRDAERPITLIVQTLNLSAEDLWSASLGVLDGKGIQVESADRGLGRIQSVWVPMSDTLCGSYPRVGAPLPCNTQYTIEVVPVSAVASSFSISYRERCTERSDVFLECPGSNAERLMKSIVSEIKSFAGVVDVTI